MNNAMPHSAYDARRGEIETYFDRTAADAWAKLTSDAKVSGVRATVRAGRDAMRKTLLFWMPVDLKGVRVLDAGCGAGQLSIEAARRGADVVAVDVAGTLVNLARERAEKETFAGSIDFRTGDMLDKGLGDFDYVVAMDSLIHYEADDIVRVLEGLAPRIRDAMLFTFAPKTAALSTMHAIGKLFPKGDRAPSIRPAGDAGLRARIAVASGLNTWAPARTKKVSSGFYTSQAMELRPQ
ncbi:MAG: magnesium protoporphyrin IX methyltransferase [Parvularculaceae bacterium]|nr:magnesium protoporphyrin IX methyltransferase [Parvularculaceae bacterium]